jgi:hypothetical protein
LPAADAEPFLAKAAFEAFLAPLERLKNRFGAGCKAALEGSEGEADRSFARSVKLVRLAHFCLYIAGDGFI